MATNMSRKDLGGAAGLVVSIIHQAFCDAQNPKPDIREPARAWFASDDYQHYLSCLGLPGDWLPEFDNV